MKLQTKILLFLGCSVLSGCNTYYDPADPYTTGLRWFDRGNYYQATRYWEPLVAKNDPDAQFRYGWLLLLHVDGKGFEALDLFEKAGAQGQPKALMVLGDLYYQSPNNVTYEVTRPPFPKDLKKAYSYYLRGQRSAIYSGEKEAFARVVPLVEKELTSDDMEEVRSEVARWKPLIVGREPRRLL